MEKEQLLNDITAKVKSELSGYASKGDLEIALTKATNELKEEFKGVAGIERKLGELEKAAIAQGELLAKMKNSEPVKPLTMKQQLEGQSEAIKNIKSGNYTSKATVLPTSITSNFNGQIIPGIGQIQTREVKLVDVWAAGTLQANNQRTIRYMDQTTATNNAAARTVGAQAAESVLAWTGYSLPVESISHWIPLALEMIEDFDFIESEINNNLLKMLENKFESYLMSGTGNSPQIYGLDTKASTFDATDFAGKFKSAGKLDLIKAMSAKVSHDTMFRANYCIMNDYDALTLELEKDDFGRLIFPNFLSPNGMQIGNIRVIPTSLVTANTMYVGDFNFGTLFKSPMTVTMGLNGTDFTERQVTMLANMNAALLIKALNAGAFYKCTSISADVAEISAGA
jgi:HK97 family phage major capsid protein